MDDFIIAAFEKSPAGLGRAQRLLACRESRGEAEGEGEFFHVRLAGFEAALPPRFCDRFIALRASRA
jgi:hypothetical protein